MVVLTRLVLALAWAVAAQQSAAADPPLRFGVVSFYNPHLMYLKYQPLVDYLGDKTGRKWELAIATSYESAIRDICAGRTAVAYLGPYTYLRAHEECGVVPLVRLQTRGSATYNSLILVKQESPAKGLQDLRGGRFGFGAPMSTSSHLVPRAMLLDAGVRPGIDVACRYFWHHERAAKAVLMGEVEACGVRDLAGEKFLTRGLRVLAQSDPIANFPLVVGSHTPPEIRDALLKALVVLPAEQRPVLAIMQGWDEELSGGFAPSSHGEFASVESLARRIFGPDWWRLPESGLSCGPGDS